MKHSLNLSFQQIPYYKIQFACLALVGIIETITMSLGFSIYGDFMHRFIFYMNMAAMFYLGITLSHPISKTARNILLTGILFCLLPLLMQLRDFKFLINIEHPLERFPNYTILCSYLLCFSFAAVADEKEKASGLKFFSGCLIAASGIMFILFLLLITGHIPYNLQDNVYFSSGMRLEMNWNPNVVARVLLFGIGGTCIIFFGTDSRFKKVLLIIPLLCIEILMAFTDSRSILAMNGCLFGGIIFFSIYKRDCRSFLLGFITAILAIILTFAFLHGIYKFYWRNMNSGIIASQSTLQENSSDTDSVSYSEPSSNSSNSSDPSVNQASAVESPNDNHIRFEQILGKRSSLKYLLTFSYRTDIWSGILRGLKENPRYLLTGIRGYDLDDFMLEYCGFKFQHAHNSWLQVLIVLGIFGLLFVLYLTGLTIKTCFSLLFLKESNLMQKSTCILTAVMMGMEFFEPFLFLPDHPLDFVNITFMLLLGYLIYWDKHAEPLQKKLPASEA